MSAGCYYSPESEKGIGWKLKRDNKNSQSGVRKDGLNNQDGAQNPLPEN